MSDQIQKMREAFLHALKSDDTVDYVPYVVDDEGEPVVLVGGRFNLDRALQDVLDVLAEDDKSIEQDEVQAWTG